jgi:hypothetical protein
MRIAVVRYRADKPRALYDRLRELGYDSVTEFREPVIDEGRAMSWSSMKYR